MNNNNNNSKNNHDASSRPRPTTTARPPSASSAARDATDSNRGTNTTNVEASCCDTNHVGQGTVVNFTAMRGGIGSTTSGSGGSNTSTARSSPAPGGFGGGGGGDGGDGISNCFGVFGGGGASGSSSTNSSSMVSGTTGGGSNSSLTTGENDAFIQAMNELSVDERQQVYYDVYTGGRRLGVGGGGGGIGATATSGSGSSLTSAGGAGGAPAFGGGKASSSSGPAAGTNAAPVGGGGGGSNANSRYTEDINPIMIEECLKELDMHLTNEVNSKKMRHQPTTGVDPHHHHASHGGSGSGGGGGGFHYTEVLAYQQAMEIDMNYVTDRKFRLAFLRADRYNAKKACQRIIDFFEYKKYLWGVDKLCKDITLVDDFTATDIECLKSSGDVQQYVPKRDTYGRHILYFNLQSLFDWQYDDYTILRIRYYIYIALIFDNDSDVNESTSPSSTASASSAAGGGSTIGNSIQTQGLVLVADAMSVKTSIFQMLVGNISRFDRVVKLLHATPCRVSSIHFCISPINSQAAKLFFNVMKPIVGLQNFARIQLHCGNHIEVLYDMLQYGVPVQSLPIDPMGNIRTANHAIWILDRYKIEQQKLERERGSSARASGPTLAATPLHHATSTGVQARNSLAPPLPPHAYSSNFQHQPQVLDSWSSNSSRVMQWTSLLLPFLKPGPTSVASNVVDDGRRNILDPANSTNNNIDGDKSGRYFAEPLPNDVIIRDRGKTIDSNEGNKRFVRLIELYCPTIIEEHNGASKLEKVHVINKLRRLLEERHEVRFIKRLENANTNANGHVQGQVQLRLPPSLYMVVDPDNNEDNQFVKNKISRALRRTHQSNEEKKHKMQE